MELGHDIVQIVRPGAKDRFGDRPAGEAPRQVDGCSVQPGSSSEQEDQRTTVTTTWRAFLPGGTDLRATDRLIWDGRTFEVVGEPDVWTIDGEAHHVQASLRLIRG